MDARIRKQLETAVRDFFRALDRRDEKAWRAAFLPGALIVHDDGLEESAARLAPTVRKTAPPVRRRLTRFRFGGSPALAFAAYRNTVVFPGGKVLRFCETALLRRARGAWRFARIHYSGSRA